MNTSVKHMYNRNVGALAELFDASCLYNSPLFSALPSIVSAAWSVAPPELPVSQIISTLHTTPSPAVLGELDLSDGIIVILTSDTHF